MGREWLAASPLQPCAEVLSEREHIYFDGLVWPLIPRFYPLKGNLHSYQRITSNQRI